MTPVAVRRSALGRLAAFVLVMLIVSPFTAPFSVMSGTLEASPNGPADSIQSVTAQAPGIGEVPFLHAEPSWHIVPFRALGPKAIVEFTRVSRILRL